MSNNKLIGRKVRILPDTLFYHEGMNNDGIIESVAELRGNHVVMVDDGYVRLACYPHEVKYLNNKPVVLP